MNRQLPVCEIVHGNTFPKRRELCVIGTNWQLYDMISQNEGEICGIL